MEEDPEEDILDVFHIGAAIKTESYEICEYESLIDMAREMKHAKVAKLLGQNLKEENAALRKMEGTIPAAATGSWPAQANDSAAGTAPGERVATTISMSAIVSRIRRRLPATLTASTPPTPPSASTTACACGSTTPMG